ncbi:MupA/Atu3671 family FMN-dependent luciferase-like monooxygenase [Paracoccus benzoatiresistens]|uniref:LLM class flavin-dependent oxidoreductase n=1 Tax=Paracoccus benzoatiresistens TaxID=2997341 RepID=A0ABT4J8T1_9RHOB|nr:MupA/Atu3671 family FMN-dependent luciferase-like monooxygenase [Paracoccus sp. EF6]MCZ0963324.1 LLM class flavin-dependent oxidoreductase [Paracoccus sp. EF6]
MTPLNLLLIGNESLTRECGLLAEARGHRIAGVVTRHPGTATWARQAGISVHAPASLRDGSLLSLDVDWILSIANLNLVPDAVLALARRGAVNFHDGPLPRYAGLNAPAWARIADERQHGISWHRIEGNVDEGRVLVQRHFAIDPEDTALTLNAKAWEAGRESFPELLGALEADALGIPQDLSKRSLFQRARRPRAAGRLDFTRPAAELIALVRGLDHGPYANPLLTAKIALDGRVVAVGAIELASGAGMPGTILACDDDAILVACGDGAVRLDRLVPADGCKNKLSLSPGRVLPSPGEADTKALDQAVTKAAVREGFWRQQLVRITPAMLELLPEAEEAQPRELEVLLPRAIRGDEAVALFAAALARTADLEAHDLAFARAVHPDVAGYISDWVPLHVDTSDPELTLEGLAQQIIATRATLEGAGWLADLPLRVPELASMQRPLASVAAEGATIHAPGLTLRLPHGRVDRLALSFDAARLAPHTVQRLARLMSRLAAIPADAPLRSAELVTQEDRACILGPWNDTASALDPVTIDTAFAAQVAKTPEATALIFEDRKLSYAELDRLSNRIAHALKALGVGPDRPVGLFAARGPDMVSGAIGILKAGGAYVPLDPTYPADRIAHYLTDSGAPVILADADLTGQLPAHSARILTFSDPTIAAQPDTAPENDATSKNLAYLIYTSGSTGTPKGVMVEHRNVANLFAGMDNRIPHAHGGVWLAVTSLSFDISVLEIFWTLSRGFTVVLAGDAMKGAVGGHGQSGGMDFSLYYWGNDDGVGSRKYDLLLEGARFADAHGFKAVWTPERHFHAFGGPYPNPSVTGAAVAAVTKNLAVRAGSCVAPLHHPARIAEEWAVIDNLTDGKAGIAIASGWQPDDFVLRPENTPPTNKKAMFTAMDQVRRLWRGETIDFPTANGGTFGVVTQPRPVSKELPVWVTVAGSPATWAEAGRHGANVLTHLLGQSIADVKQRITEYHAALREAGHDPADFTVTLMLHTFLTDRRDAAMEIARGPMKDYLRAAAGLVKQYAWAFPAFKKPAGLSDPMSIDLSMLTDDELEGILEFAFLRYFNDSGLFGTIEDATARVTELHDIGVTEIACLIDYGIPTATVLEGLRPLAELVQRVNATAGPAHDDFSIAAQIRRHRVTHLQCTPSMARLLVADSAATQAIGRLQTLLLGGEALPPALLVELQALTGARILNMYGPTETTIWSTTAELGAGNEHVTLGRPINNTRLYVLDQDGRLMPPGVSGELWISGAGVVRGYWNRADLTAAAFRPDPFVLDDNTRMYRTGDLVRWTEEGVLEFLGRVDQQVKLRGHRIELGEIEARLEVQPGVREAAVVARTDAAGSIALVAFATGEPSLDPAELRKALRSVLPEVMIPSRIIVLPELPLTPNRKLDRKTLARMELPVSSIAVRETAPSLPPQISALVVDSPRSEDPTEFQARVAAIWAKALGLERVSSRDNFFALGGHSLLAVQVHRTMKTDLNLPRLSITDIFRYPVLGDFAAHVSGRVSVPANGAAPRLLQSEASKTPAPQEALPTPAPPPTSQAEGMARRRALRQQVHQL